MAKFSVTKRTDSGTIDAVLELRVDTRQADGRPHGFIVEGLVWHKLRVVILIMQIAFMIIQLRCGAGIGRRKMQHAANKTKRKGKLMKSVLLHEIIKNYAAKCFVN